MGAGFHGGFGETKGAVDQHQEYLRTELPKSSPITIPSTAKITEEKKNGYKQVKYSWEKGDYSYTSRWHTRTPNAPAEQGDSWVVQRDKAGIGYGKNARPAQHDILIGSNKWVSKKRMASSYSSSKKRYRIAGTEGDVRSWTLES